MPICARGRPSTRWLDDTENDIKILKIKNWQRVALDRLSWKKRAVEAAKTCNSNTRAILELTLIYLSRAQLTRWTPGLAPPSSGFRATPAQGQHFSGIGFRTWSPSPPKPYH
ncbi:hypothetical protein AVEN_273744-1 [Araneus ventricosus]|uniref:Uncharacterized protein n=1 Tax=Araneus ventricosus TaxID=182803 RepID=A0A4Y2R9I3_ARAVE|nr:hypothetical protein AVEN_273744-1 [Araneus ventricosus]